MGKIPARYNNIPANASLVYDSICKVLSECGEQVDWGEFSAAEWGLLPNMAQAEGVGPLLYWKLKRRETGDRGRRTGGRETELTAAVHQALKASYYATAAHNTLLFRELDRILAALAEANIPVILLKGAALP